MTRSFIRSSEMRVLPRTAAPKDVHEVVSVRAGSAEFTISSASRVGHVHSQSKCQQRDSGYQPAGVRARCAPDSQKRGDFALGAAGALGKRMKICTSFSLLFLFVASAASAAQSLCPSLRDFVKSVEPGETREFTFHTFWGGNFKDSQEEAIAAKRCNRGGYIPAEAVCEYLMKHGAVEFAGSNVESALTCLSPKTRFAPMVGLHSGSFSLHIGSDDRGANIEMDFYEDSEIGGMAFKVSAAGY